MRETIHLECTKCRRINYTTAKNKKNDPDRIELKKYCKFCREHIPHKEVR